MKRADKNVSAYAEKIAQQEALLDRHAQERRALERAEQLARTMDAAFTIPGTSIPLGVDTLVGLIPGIGDTVSLGLAAFIAGHGTQTGARKGHYVQMGANIFIDWLIGLVPVIGDIFDIGWKGNLRNVALLRKQAEARWAAERAAANIIEG